MRKGADVEFVEFDDDFDDGFEDDFTLVEPAELELAGGPTVVFGRS